MKHRT